MGTSYYRVRAMARICAAPPVLPEQGRINAAFERIRGQAAVPACILGVVGVRLDHAGSEGGLGDDPFDALSFDVLVEADGEDAAIDLYERLGPVFCGGLAEDIAPRADAYAWGWLYAKGPISAHAALESLSA